MAFPEPPVPFSLPYRGERLEWAIAVIGWSKNQAAARLPMDENSLRQMMRNRRFIPDVLGIWFETMAQFHLTFAKPMAWNDRPKPASPQCGAEDIVPIESGPVVLAAPQEK